FLEFLQSNAQMQQQLRAPIFEDKVVDMIFAIATVTERDVTKDELQDAVKKLEDLAD
ncbi:MAG: trigger factor, partial [Mangrovicoccus sp.]|nr:trigger factor [Mangrovicoccus sp.]